MIILMRELQQKKIIHIIVKLSIRMKTDTFTDRIITVPFININYVQIFFMVNVIL